MSICEGLGPGASPHAVHPIQALSELIAPLPSCICHAAESHHTGGFCHTLPLQLGLTEGWGGADGRGLIYLFLRAAALDSSWGLIVGNDERGVNSWFCRGAHCAGAHGCHGDRGAGP